jgi:fumarate reductase flavoprotein subunit
MLTDPQGISVPPPVLIEGGVIVNRLGDRFTDESADIAGMVHPLAGQPDGLGWVIYDARIEERCAEIPELAQLMALKAPKMADDLETLATLTGTGPSKLMAAIAEVQRVAKAKGADALGRSWSNDRPPSGPYRALKVTGALYHTQGGLQVDGAARVLRGDGTAFANLFAGGGSARSVSGPSSWGYLPAMGLTTAVVLGRLAGQGAACVSAI